MTSPEADWLVDTAALPRSRDEVGLKAHSLATIERETALPTVPSAFVPPSSVRRLRSATGSADRKEQTRCSRQRVSRFVSEFREFELSMPVMVRFSIGETAPEAVQKRISSERVDAVEEVLPTIERRVRGGSDGSKRETPLVVIVQELLEPRHSGILHVTDRRIVTEYVQGFLDDLTSGTGTPKRTALGSGPDESDNLDDSVREQLCEIEDQLRPITGDAYLVEWISDGKTVYPNEVVPISNSAQGRIPAGESPDGESVPIGRGQPVVSGTVTGEVRPAEPRPIRSEGIRSEGRRTIYVLEDAKPEYTRLLGNASAIVTESGGITSHLGTVARERGVVSVFGVDDVTDAVKAGDEVTIHPNGEVYVK